MDWDGKKNTWDVTFGYKDNVLTQYVINSNNTGNMEYVETFSFSIDENNPNKFMKEKWIHITSNTSAVVPFFKSDCKVGEY